MAVDLLWFVGNQNPSIAEELTSGGIPFPLTGSTVRFKMRAEHSAVLKVNQPAVIVNAPLGQVRYDWASADVDTAGRFLIWWEVTNGGKTEDMAESVIEFRPHSDATPLYIDPTELKSIMDVPSSAFMDRVVQLACTGATRAIEQCTRRRFWLDANNTLVRYYTPEHLRTLQIDDLVVLNTFKVDRTGDGVYEETWVNGTDFVLQPFNAPAEMPARPYEWVELRRMRGQWFPADIEKSVQVTGQFGWPAVPDDIKVCAVILARKLVIRMRDAPHGIVAVGHDGAAMRIARNDPDVAPVLEDYSRKRPWA